ncbi:transporter substrate-binding domain-containing protein [uncultured Pseudoteredinibacter sp.]|uniref:substrate-binding periplasmic protein n=1 Tax=uncultured Pseudoteredinibacter sp. TaxID=1641701 RepID=UPI002604002F|nr:transporter substrate-binding domain-containing protein [uncultured Pseudoteredinibacter sp.]
MICLLRSTLRYVVVLAVLLLGSSSVLAQTSALTVTENVKNAVDKQAVTKVLRTEQTVLTNTWAPYINTQGEEVGQAAQVLELIFRYSDVRATWQYVPYELAFYEVSEGQQLLSYPYFKTVERAEKVLYSDPIFTVASQVFYNRQYLNQQQAKNALDKHQRIGRVAGYSYGASLDKIIAKAKIYNSEKRALTALFNGEIDLLPMTQSVMNQLLESDYKERKQLIRPIENLTDNSSMYLVAAKNAQGRLVIDRVNKALARLKNAGLSSLQNEPFETPDSIDIANLVTSEGYPSILGQSAESGSKVEYFTLPLGTQVIVLSWSENMLRPASNDRLYHHMMDLSKVLVLNGPHVGKELFVRNMHIELQ